MTTTSAAVCNGFCDPFRTADIFCAVIDNFGDAGVCWRLAKRLAALGLAVRLITDRPDVLANLVPALKPALASSEGRASLGRADGIEVLDWRRFASQANPGAADLIIETFACRLPENYERAIAGRLQAKTDASDPRIPFYFNLDYLSAEAWVEDYHNIWGLHPTLPIRKLWFFPGFTDRTGGLLIEDDYKAREAAFLSQKQSFLESLGCDPSLRTLFFFAYPKNAVEAFAAGLLARPEPINVLAAPGEAGDRLASAVEVPQARTFACVVRPFCRRPISTSSSGRRTSPPFGAKTASCARSSPASPCSGQPTPPKIMRTASSSTPGSSAFCRALNQRPSETFLPKPTATGSKARSRPRRSRGFLTPHPHFMPACGAGASRSLRAATWRGT